jgi:hypothetical protein
MSSSVLGLHSASRAHSGPAAGGSFDDGPRTTGRAGHPRPADPVGYCGRRCVAGHCGLEPAMRSRRWRSDAVRLPGPAHGCPELVKHILHTDIGVGMSSQRALPGPHQLQFSHTHRHSLRHRQAPAWPDPSRISALACRQAWEMPLGPSSQLHARVGRDGTGSGPAMRPEIIMWSWSGPQCLVWLAARAGPPLPLSLRHWPLPLATATIAGSGADGARA